MKDEFDQRQLRAIQYQHVDGSLELTYGVTFLLVAGCFHLISRVTLPNSSFLPFAPLLVFIGGVFLIDTLIQRLRRRVTYPRSGYIAYRQPRPLKRTTRLVIWIGVPVLTALLLMVLYLNRPAFPVESQDYVTYLMPGFFGLLFSGLWMVAGWKIALPRFYLIAAASLLIGTALFVSGVGGYPGMAWLLGAQGALLCASGGVTLWLYLRRTPLPAESPDEQ